jgi:adenylosuccinate lyase
MTQLDLEPFPVATQTYPRKQDWFVLSTLAGIAGSLYKFAFDLRLLQSPAIGEWSEPFGQKQVGSSAMPFKRNPVHAENIDSLARYVAALPRVAWDNAAHSLLERTLDDSGNRREIIPTAFLAVDELLQTANQLVNDLQIYSSSINKNMELYGVFAATERVLMESVRRGADRQQVHELIRQYAMKAWAIINNQKTVDNPLLNLLSKDASLLEYLTENEIIDLLNARTHIGDAPTRARTMVDIIRRSLQR